MIPYCGCCAPHNSEEQPQNLAVFQSAEPSTAKDSADNEMTAADKSLQKTAKTAKPRRAGAKHERSAPRKRHGMHISPGR
jgi:hypothetical protein